MAKAVSLLFELVHLRFSISAMKTGYSLGALGFLLAASACSAATVGHEPMAGALNRVSNPNFHSGVFSPEKWDLNRPAGNQAYWLFDKAHPGANGVQLIGSGADWAGLTSRSVSVEPGATVTIAAWLRTSGANPASDCVFVRFFGAKGFVGQQGAAIPAAEAQWTLVSAAVRVPDGAVTADASIQLRSKAWYGSVRLGFLMVIRPVGFPRCCPGPS